MFSLLAVLLRKQMGGQRLDILEALAKWWDVDRHNL
jgi:hypothetical protein